MDLTFPRLKLRSNHSFIAFGSEHAIFYNSKLTMKAPQTFGVLEIYKIHKLVKRYRENGRGKELFFEGKLGKEQHFKI